MFERECVPLSQKPKKDKIMDISKQTRTTQTTEGKRITFTCNDGWYLVPQVTAEEKRELFSLSCKGDSYCIAYTTISHDKGINGLTLEHFDNGLVGWQNYDFFKTEEEAKREFELKSRLSSKVGVVGYCDVFLISKD